MTGLADAHVHLFPDAAAGVAWQTGAGIAEPRRDGTLARYRELTAAAGVTGLTVLLHARAQTLLPDSVRPEARPVDDAAVLDRITGYNRWGLRTLRAPGVATVIGVDPALMSDATLRAEIAVGAEHGAAGVKFAPASSRLYLDDPRCLAAFDAAVANGLPVVVQSGHAGATGDRGHPFGRPGHLRAALDALPELRVVLAHFGEGYDDEVVALARSYPGVLADLSMRLTRTVDVAALANLVVDFGVDRVMFGSNYPIADPARAAAGFAGLARHGVDLEAVGLANWRRVFGESPAEAPTALPGGPA